MIEIGLLDRIVKVHAAASGTGLVHSAGGRDFLITARHVIDSFSDTIGLSFPYSSERVTQKLGMLRALGDVCVIALDAPVDFDEPGYEMVPDEPRVGEGVIVPGYPTGEAVAESLESYRFDTPFVTRATLANRGVGDRFYLDRTLNPGFAGAPVVVIHSGGARVIGFASGDSPEAKGFAIAYHAGVALELIGEALRGEP